MSSGRRQEDWEKFMIVRDEASRVVANSKEKYFINLSQNYWILQTVLRHSGLQ